MFLLALLCLSEFNILSVVSKPFHFQNNDIEYKNIRDNIGNYEYTFNTRFFEPSEDMGRTETGTIGKTAAGEDVLRVEGTYHYQPTCDHVIEVHYVADENGFRSHMTETFSRTYTEVNGTITAQAWCSTVNRPEITSNCIASLQGGCTG